MPSIPTSIVDNHGVSYVVKFKPPTKFNPVARVEVFDEQEFLVAEVMFGERNPGYFYIDDLQVHRGLRQVLVLASSRLPRLTRGSMVSMKFTER